MNVEQFEATLQDTIVRIIQSHGGKVDLNLEATQLAGNPQEGHSSTRMGFNVEWPTPPDDATLKQINHEVGDAIMALVAKHAEELGITHGGGIMRFPGGIMGFGVMKASESEGVSAEDGEDDGEFWKNA
jgi:hypothetical protein